MMTPAELKRFIRFALEGLRADNAHHEFEHLSRAIATARISQNIIPATGPVGAGGDQGRDAESVPRLDDVAQAPGLYGDLSGRTVVLTCTLQRADVHGKIAADVMSIRSHPELKADVIVAFTEADIPVGTRNRLKEVAWKDHRVELHVIDGNAIAEFLCAYDLNWVAHKYLDLPREAAPSPRSDEDDAWYLDQRLRWADRSPHRTWGDLEAVRQSLRYAYQHGFTADLGLWLELFEPFRADDTPTDIRRIAVYEIALAYLRGRDTLDPAKDDLAWYFDTITDVKPSATLQDAQVLVTFCFGAAGAGRPGVSFADVQRWRTALVEHIEREIDDTDNPARLYSLLLTRGALEWPSENEPVFDDLRHWWDRALDHAHSATMLPIDLVADRLPPLAPAFADDPSFREFVSRVDDLAAAQGGEAASAENALARAVALLEADRLTAALRELHRAKDRFLNAHQTGRLLSVLTLIGRAYYELRLWWAAKQYFLAAASVAMNSSETSHRRYIALGLAQAAGCDYDTGGWCGFIGLAGIATRAHGLLDVEPGDIEAHPFLSELGLSAALVALAAQHHLPDLADDALALARAHVPPGPLNELLTDPPAWVIDVDEYVAAVAEHLHARPFDDAGPQRTLRWSAHGVAWSLIGPAQASRVAAERLAAVMQVIEADIAGLDHVPLPMTATIEVTIGANGDIGETGPGRFSATVPPWTNGAPHEAMERAMSQTTAAAVALIGQVTAISTSELLAKVEKCFEDNLTNKATVFRMYDEMLHHWAPQHRTLDAGSLGSSPAPQPSHEELAWPSGPGPGYTDSSVEEALRNRYRNLTEMTAVTLPRLIKDDDFQSVVAELRSRGWLDWHILGAVLSVARGYRMERDLAAGRTTMREAASVRFGPEEVIDPIPLSEFTIDALLQGHQGNNLATLISTWERELHLRAVPSEAVDLLLRARYGHYSDDIVHDDPFTAAASV